MQKLFVYKIGGNVTDNSRALETFLKKFSQIRENKILVHGGGKKATEIAEKLGIESKMQEGRRITTPEMLDVALMVYAGLTNKNIVALLQAFDCNALGLTGADLNIIKAEKRPIKEIDYGFVGDIVEIDTEKIDFLLKNQITLVFCALTHNQKGQLLNTNADTIASTLASALSQLYEITLVYCFEKAGVLLDVEKEDSLIEQLNEEKYLELKNEAIIHSGMIPKLDNAFRALKMGVKEIWICKAETISQEKMAGTLLNL